MIIALLSSALVGSSPILAIAKSMDIQVTRISDNIQYEMNNRELSSLYITMLSRPCIRSHQQHIRIQTKVN